MTGRPGATGPSLGVVVTNYQTWDLTRRCVEAVAQLGGADEVVVVDDASAAPPPPRLDAYARILINAQNQGLCRSLNRGVRECATDIVVLFDSDAYPLVEFATPLRAAFAGDPRLAVAGFATVGAGGRPTGSWEEEPGVLGFILGPRLDGWRRRLRRSRRLPERLSVFTCAMAVRRDAFLSGGGFDEAFDWLDLDHDLSMRLRGAGFRLTVCPDLVAFHEGGGAPQATSERVLRAYKNRWRLLRKHGKIRSPALVGGLVRLRLSGEWLALRLGSSLLRHRRDLAEKAVGRRTLLRWGAENLR